MLNPLSYTSQGYLYIFNIIMPVTQAGNFCDLTGILHPPAPMPLSELMKVQMILPFVVPSDVKKLMKYPCCLQVKLIYGDTS